MINRYRNYSTNVNNLLNKMKNYKFYCDYTKYPCHCVQYGEPCKLFNNKEAHINFSKHILYINNKKKKEKESDTVYKKQMDNWLF
jgi:hypothetical protein